MKKRLCAALLFLILIFSTLPVGAADFRYQHDPRLDARTMQNIMYDPSAVYGFVPDPNSLRLGSYAHFDWTDEQFVEKSRQERLAYHAEFRQLLALKESMEAEGKSVEETARAVSALRNELRLASYKDDPEGLLAVKESNLKKYGNENGPTPEYLFEKSASWDAVLLSAFSSNAGMDAILGLYDEEYENNLAFGAIAPASAAYYTVQKGDYLCKIAQRYYGSTVGWSRIFNANRATVKNANLIYAGQTLLIPLD